MQYKTHILFSIVCLLFYFDYATLQHPIIFMIIVLFTTLFVDIDESGSALGKKIRPLSTIIQWLLGHRGLLHSILVPLLLYLILVFFQYKEIGTAIVLGYLSHISMDALTKQGVRICYPLPYRICGPITVGSWSEKCIGVLLLLVITVQLLFLLLSYFL